MIFEDGKHYIITYKSITEHKKLRKLLKGQGYEKPTELTYSGQFGSNGYFRYKGEQFVAYGSMRYLKQTLEGNTLHNYSGMEIIPFDKIEFDQTPEELFNL